MRLDVFELFTDVPSLGQTEFETKIQESELAAAWAGYSVFNWPVLQVFLI